MNTPAKVGAPLVSLRDVRIEYRRGRTRFVAVPKLSLDIAAGETVGLVGESGSGKTTVGRAIQGLVNIASGSIVLDGENIATFGRRRIRTISGSVQTIFQDPFGSLNPARTIGSTIAESLTIRERQLSRSAATDRVAEALERVGLRAADSGRYPSQFSGGQRQRIAIARALISNPRLIICDEAVSALDLSVQAQVLNLLADIQTERRISYLFITHDLAVVRHIAQRVLVLKEGTIMDEFASSAMQIETRSPYTQRLFAAAPVPDPLKQRAKRIAFEQLSTHSSN